MTLSIARQTLLEQKILLAKKNVERQTLIDASQSTTEIDANIALLQTAITSQKANVRTFSAQVNLTTVNTWATAASSSSTFDAVPTSGSTNAVRSGGVHASLETKQNLLTSSTDITAGNLGATTWTTSSIDCTGGSILGNVTTPSQSSITQLGTLEALSVNGPVDILSPNFTVDSTTKRVGVAKASPEYAMDITGNLNTIQTGTLHINAVPVLSRTSLGNGIVDSSLTTTGTLESLTVSGNVNIDSNTLRVNSVDNRVGIAKSTPLYPLDIAGSMNLAGTGNVYRVNGTTVLARTYLGNAITTSNLTSVGTLVGANISGNIVHTVGTASLKDVSVSQNLICSDNLSVTNRGTFLHLQASNTHTLTTTTLPQGGHIVWNSFNTGTGETDFVNKSGSGTGGFLFYNSTGNESTLATGKSLLASLTPESFAMNGFAKYQVPVFKVIKRDGKNANNVDDGVQVTAVADTNLLIGDKTQIINDNKNGWNRTDGAYVAPYDGYYRFDVYMRLQDDTSTTNYFSFKAEVTNSAGTILANQVQAVDNAVFVTKSADNVGRMHGHLSTTAYMNATDRFRIRCAQASGTTIVHEVQLAGSLTCI